VSALYTDPLVALAARLSPLPARPSHQATARNRYCADEVVVAVNVDEEVIVELGWAGESCIVCRASAAWLTERLRGRPLRERAAVREELERALSGGSAPDHAFAGLQAHPSRHSCARLPWQALERALGPPVPHRAAPPSAPEPPAAGGEDAWSVALRWQEAGEAVCIATLVDVVGSSPCPLGAHMVVSETGAFWGAVSGGCVESAVVQASLELMAAGGGPMLRSFQISNSQAGAVGLPCGGRVEVHIGPAPGRRLLRAYQAKGRGLGRVIDLESGQESLEAVENERPRREGARFIEPLSAPPRLLVVGGTRIAQLLVRLAQTLDFHAVVIEPRPGFAGPGRFDCTVVQERPEHALPRLLGPDAAVVMLTHSPELDDPGLRVALASDAVYVGALGSRKTQAARLARLAAAGVPAAQLARLRGPAGLPIGSKGAGEIALSILAEVVATRRRAEPRGIGAVVLAAGRSRRAGERNKLLQDIDGEPMVRRVARSVVGAALGPVVVVLGHDGVRVREALEGLPVQFVENADHESGMGTSIAAGITAIAAHGVGAAFVVLGDMPWLQPAQLQALARAHVPATQHLVIVPVAGPPGNTRRGNPVLWPARYFSALQALRGDTGGKGILARAPGAVLELAVEGDGVLVDVDGILGENRSGSTVRG
jgi:xanthine dehydrogenase accessory factor